MAERVRHHTSPEALSLIQEKQEIRWSRTGGVDVERPPFGVLWYWKDWKLTSASDDLGAHGRGADVEFDVAAEHRLVNQPLGYFRGGRTGATVELPSGVEGLRLASLRPHFVVWLHWYHRMWLWMAH